MNKLRIAVIFDDGVRGVGAGTAADGTVRGDFRIAVAAVEAALRDAGHDAVRVPLDFPLSRGLGALEAGGFDLVFNLCEGLGDVTSAEVGVAALLDLACVRYTGADPLALGLALDKARSKELLAARGVRTPRWCVLRDGATPLPAGFPFPAIVKPLFEDGSLGIDDASVVGDEPAMRARVAFVHEHFAEPALVEEFIDGRELNVSVLDEGARRFALPVAEIEFGGMPAGKPRIVTFNAKWHESSVEFHHTVPVVPALLTEAVAAEVRACALQAAEVLGVRDYARVDLRLDRQNRPWVLEVNPNPDISPDAGLPRAAWVHGWTYEQLVQNVVDMAMRRAPRSRRSARLLAETANR